jgi:hypothetical protein
MSEAVLAIRAECRSCGWLEVGSERKAKNSETEALFCPQCSGVTKSWVIDNHREQQALDRDKSARIESTQQANDAFRQARLANQQLRDARRRTEFARHKVALLDKDHPKYLEAQHAMIAAQREEAEAALARDQAMTRVNAGGR